MHALVSFVHSGGNAYCIDALVVPAKPNFTPGSPPTNSPQGGVGVPCGAAEFEPSSSSAAVHPVQRKSLLVLIISLIHGQEN